MIDPQHLLLTLVYTLFGMLVFGVSFVAIVRFTPFSVRKEIEEDQNTALAILLGSVFIGLAIIIGSTVSG
jgi:putative membrane protein